MRRVPIHLRVLTNTLWLGVLAQRFQAPPVLPPVIDGNGKVIQ